MPASAPFPFWLVGGGVGSPSLNIRGFDSLADGYDGWEMYLYAGEGFNNAALYDSQGGRFTINAGDGRTVTGNSDYSMGGGMYFTAGAGGSSTGVSGGSQGGNTGLFAGAGGPSTQYYSRGGELYLQAGIGGNSDYNSYGGNVQIIAGNAGASVSGSPYGGSVLMYAGDAGAGYGGDIHIYAGTGVAGGGEISIYSYGSFYVSGETMVISATSGDMGLYATGNVNVIPRTPGQTVGSLPAAAAGNLGTRRMVTDSNAASFTLGIGVIVAGGGATVVPVVSDGANWRIG